RSKLTKVSKIGEGLFSEVFCIIDGDGGKSIWKIIPVNGDVKYNGSFQKSWQDIYSELLIIKCISDHSIKNEYFPSIFSLNALKGKFPPKLVKAWNESDAFKTSENDHPKKFKNTQNYIVIESKYYGEPLDKLEKIDIDQALSIFIQVCLGLSIAEKEMKFEHRDLHTGNILCLFTNYNEERDIKKSPQESGFEFDFISCGIQITIIDFSLSSMYTASHHIAIDLCDEVSLFEGPDDEYQFEVYRMMRTALDNQWVNQTNLRTNLIWLHYLLDKLLEKVGQEMLAVDSDGNLNIEGKSIEDCKVSKLLLMSEWKEQMLNDENTNSASEFIKYFVIPNTKILTICRSK
ncbi:MAG: Serine/threonine-protein kinase haspin, partial [Marteilia pararefringens]